VGKKLTGVINKKSELETDAGFGSDSR